MASLNKAGLYTLNTRGLSKLGVNLKVYTAEAANVVLDNLGPALVDQWRHLAGKKLNTSRERYIASILPPRRDNRALILGLESGGIAEAVEKGRGPYNMRDDLLRDGADSKVIPFRVKGPGQKSGGVRPGSFGIPAGRPYARRDGEEAGRQIGREVWREIRALNVGERLGTNSAPQWTRQKYDLKPGMLRRALGLKKMRKVRGQETTSPSIYTGVRREVARSLNNRTNQRNVYKFTSYRTISTDIKAGDWVHPGIQKRDLLGETLEAVPKAVQDILEGFSGEVFK